jgi:hypothetical protein
MRKSLITLGKVAHRLLSGVSKFSKHFSFS